LGREEPGLRLGSIHVRKESGWGEDAAKSGCATGAAARFGVVHSALLTLAVPQ